MAAHATARSEVVHHTTTTVTTTTHHLVTSHHVLVESEEGREEVRWHRGSGAGPTDGLGEGTLGAATESCRPTFHAQCVCSGVIVGIGGTEDSISILTLMLHTIRGVD